MKKAMKNAGFTLVEMMFVTLIFPMVFIAIYTAVDMASQVFRTNDVYSDVNLSGMQALRTLAREITQTSSVAAPQRLVITADGNGNSVVRFQIPVDWDNDGDADTGGLTPTTEWGAYDDIGHSRACQASTGVANCLAPNDATIVGRWVRYRVIPNPNFPPGVVDNSLVREVLTAGLALDGAVALNPRIITNNIQVTAGAGAGNFTVVQNGNVVTTNLTLTSPLVIDQKNGVRNITANFTQDTILRGG